MQGIHVPVCTTRLADFSPPRVDVTTVPTATFPTMSGHQRQRVRRKGLRVRAQVMHRMVPQSPRKVKARARRGNPKPGATPGPWRQQAPQVVTLLRYAQPCALMASRGRRLLPVGEPPPMDRGFGQFVRYSRMGLFVGNRSVAGNARH